MYYKFYYREDNELGSETRVLTTEASVPRSPTRSRLRSLDIFRGFSIALMVRIYIVDFLYLFIFCKMQTQ